MVQVAAPGVEGASSSRSAAVPGSACDLPTVHGCVRNVARQVLSSCLPALNSQEAAKPVHDASFRCACLALAALSSF